MKKQQHITAFYLETLLLIVVFISIILVLTQIFGMGKLQSGEAKRLTNAVCLAENAAEAFAAATTPEEAAALLNENDNAALTTDTAGVTARYDTDMKPDAAGPFRVELLWQADGELIHAVIQVFYGGDGDPVYTLRTAHFAKGAAA